MKQRTQRVGGLPQAQPVGVHAGDYGQTACEPCEPSTRAEAEANANLIAAAPELLAALKALIPTGVFNGTEQQCIDHWQYELAQGNEEAPFVLAGYAAIRKAEGRS